MLLPWLLSFYLAGFVSLGSLLGALSTGIVKATPVGRTLSTAVMDGESKRSETKKEESRRGEPGRSSKAASAKKTSPVRERSDNGPDNASDSPDEDANEIGLAQNTEIEPAAETAPVADSPDNLATASPTAESVASSEPTGLPAAPQASIPRVYRQLSLTVEQQAQLLQVSRRFTGPLEEMRGRLDELESDYEAELVGLLNAQQQRQLRQLLRLREE